MRIEMKGRISRNETVIGETLETKVKRIVTSGEPLRDGAELIYQEEAYTINPDCDPRTDKQEIAVLAMDKVNQSRYAKRNGLTELGKEVKEDNGTETTV